METNQPDPASPKRPRGRPAKPGGAKTQAEIQRAYRERKKAMTPDPATFAGFRDQLMDALAGIERREQDIARLTARNAYLERELKLQEQHHTIAIKDIIGLKKQLAERTARKKPAKPG